MSLHDLEISFFNKESWDYIFIVKLQNVSDDFANGFSFALDHPRYQVRSKTFKYSKENLEKGDYVLLLEDDDESVFFNSLEFLRGRKLSYDLQHQDNDMIESLYYNGKEVEYWFEDETDEHRQLLHVPLIIQQILPKVLSLIVIEYFYALCQGQKCRTRFEANEQYAKFCEYCRQCTKLCLPVCCEVIYSKRFPSVKST